MTFDEWWSKECASMLRSSHCHDTALGISRLAWHAAQPRWIPCSERLPEYGKRVLLYLDSNRIRIGERTRDGDGEYLKCTDWLCRVSQATHWQPLPAPPETI